MNGDGMKVRKLTAKWGSKGMGAEVSIWLPEVTYGTYEMLAGGEKTREIQRAVIDAIREIVRDVFPVTADKPGKMIDVEMSVVDDETGERVW
jgi:hypothetical protein